MQDNKSKTIICDIDGVLFHHYCKGLSGQVTNEPRILTDVYEKFQYWDSNGYNIVLITGRKESLRNITTNLLHSFGLYFDKLVMGVGGGDRILINDRKPDGRPTAWTINNNRNEGLVNTNYDNLSVLTTVYFEAWSAKDVSKLKEMFSEEILLQDWNVSCEGKENVLKANENIFSSVKKLSVDIKSLSHVGNKVLAEINVVADETVIPVLDVIKYDENSKIQSIIAYRGN